MPTNFFVPGKLSVILDASAGSSGKGKIGSYVTKQNVGKFTFVCNTFSTQASHFVFDKDHPEFCYKHLNSNAHRHHEFEKLYIGQGAVITLKELFKEIEMTGIPRTKIGISPLCAICQDIDRLYEEGKVDLAGNETQHSGTISGGSTCSGVGASRARRVLRDKNILLAKDVPELADMICDVPGEIMARLRNGESGLLEIAQGFQLSNGYRFFPNCTARNVTVTAGLDDMFLPPSVVGNVLLNLRTYPIRIASKKYVSDGTFKLKISDTQIDGKDTAAVISHAASLLTSKYDIAVYPSGCVIVREEQDMGLVMRGVTEKGKHLTHKHITSGIFGYEEVNSYSGDGYDDQKEISWEQVEAQYGSPIPEDVKLTSLTKLMRRVFTFSKQNLEDAILYNQPPDGNMIYLSLNFVNWIDGKIEGASSVEDIPFSVSKWISDNIDVVLKRMSYIHRISNVQLAYLGTGRYTEETIDMNQG